MMQESLLKKKKKSKSEEWKINRDHEIYTPIVFNVIFKIVDYQLKTATCVPIFGEELSLRENDRMGLRTLCVPAKPSDCFQACCGVDWIKALKDPYPDLRVECTSRMRFCRHCWFTKLQAACSFYSHFYSLAFSVFGIS